MSFLEKHRNIINVLIMGVGFLFLFGAFQTSVMVEPSVLSAEKVRSNGTFDGDGYDSLAIIYVTFAFANWLSPIIVVWITPKFSMISAGIVYSLFILSFLHPITSVLYIGSFLLGLAAAILWTAQGNCLSVNSNTETITRNTALFWCLFQSSLVFGNIVNYFVFRQTDRITKFQQTLFYSIFGGCALFGVGILLTLRKSSAEKIHDNNYNESIAEDNEIVDDNQQTEIIQGNKKTFTPLEAFFQSFQLIRTKHMLLLFLPMIYTGFELTFFSGVYGTAVGQTKYFGENAKGYIGLIGIAIGLGEMISCFLFNFLSKVRPSLFKPDLIIVIGVIIHLVSFFIAFISLPFDSTKMDSFATTYITPNAGVLIFNGFLLGVGDSIFNTQIISLLGDYYKGIDSPSAFALFKFSQSLCSGVAFFYSRYLDLQWQLMILCITGLAGTISFMFVERQVREKIIQRNIDAVEQTIVGDHNFNNNEGFPSING